MSGLAMGRGEIGWTRKTEEGIRLDVYAHRVRTEWHFYARAKRYEPWQLIENPPLEDWIELLDAVRRRIDRRMLRPEEESRVRKIIQERFPEVKLE